MLERLFVKDFVEILNVIHEERPFVVSACRIYAFTMPNLCMGMLILSKLSLHELDASKEYRISF